MLLKMPSKPSQKFLILSIILSILPFFILFKDLDFSILSTNPTSFWLQTSHIFGAVFGFIGSVLMVWELMLGIRYIVNLFTPDLIYANKIHSIIGKYGMLLVLVHPILEMYNYLENWLWLFVPDLKSNLEIHITYGRFAFILLLLIYLTSAIVRGQIKYRPWIYIHYLAYPLMFLTFIHALDIGTYLNNYPIIKALWFTLLAMYFILLVFRLAFYSSVLKKRFIVINIQNAPGDILYLDLIPKDGILGYELGQYYYIQIKPFGESHPFSLMEYDPSTGRMLFAIKILGAFTKDLARVNIHDEIFLDGPYGVFTRETDHKNKVLIAGGIGITPFVELSKQFPKYSVVFHSNKTLDESIGFKILSEALSSRYINFVTQEKIYAPNIINSRINSEHIKSILGETNLNYYSYYICGSPEFVKGIEKTLKELNIPKTQVYLEKFSN